MRHGTSSSRRSRSRGNGSRKTGSPRTQVFDSNGPDVRIRGTAFQVHEKYMNLARDAHSSGDKVLSESYLQHAEHYQRMINSWDDVRDEQPQMEDASEDEDNFIAENRLYASASRREQSQASQQDQQRQEEMA